MFDKTTILIQAEDLTDVFMRKRLWNIPRVSSSVLNTSIAAGAGDFLPVAASDGGDYFPTQTYTNVLNKRELDNFRNFYHRSFSAQTVFFLLHCIAKILRNIDPCAAFSGARPAPSVSE